MSAADRKKAESKRKKAEAKAQAEVEAKKAADKAEAASAKAKKSSAKDKPLDEDPDGVALASVTDPLERASAYLRTLLLHAPGDLDTHAYAFEIAMRKGKHLLALRALLKAKAIAPADEGVRTRVTSFLKQTDAKELPPLVAKVIALQRAKLA